jgi:ribonuclease-3
VTTNEGEGRESVTRLRELLDALPAELSGTVFMHASWTPKRADSYERLAFLGDSVLSLAITSHIFPLLERFGAGELTKIRAQTVSGRSCRAVAERLGVPERLTNAAPAGAAASIPNLISTERVLASITEAVIGACYLRFGYEPVAEAVVEAFQGELADALERPVDFKSALQERLARRGALVSYEVVNESGPPHDRTFTIAARIGQDEIGRGVGRSKKDAEQAAAEEALAHIAVAGKSQQGEARCT